MSSLTLAKIASVLGHLAPVAQAVVDRVSSDSRGISSGDLFIAIPGDNFDGHSFVAEVLARGAAGAVVERLVENAPADRQILVADTKQAYLQIGGVIRSLRPAKVIAITGSAGKTTTREMLSLVLSKFANVYATKANDNNGIGVAKTLCEIPPSAEIAVIEVGMSSAGAVANRIQFVKPDIAILTNVYAMHLEFFDSVEGIAYAEAEVFNALAPSGVAVINRDSKHFDIVEGQARKHTSSVIIYGKSDAVCAGDLKYRAVVAGREAEFELREAGDHRVLNALCVLNVVALLGFDLGVAAKALNQFTAIAGRGKVHDLTLPSGGKFRLIDDAYSAQPDSLKIAIENLHNAHQGRKIAVIGKMAEIGETSRAMHVEIGETMAATDIDIVVGVGEETKDILAQLGSGTFKTYYFDTYDGVDEFLINELLGDGDTVLIKGSHHGSKLYRTAKSVIEKCSG